MSGPYKPANQDFYEDWWCAYKMESVLVHLKLYSPTDRLFTGVITRQYPPKVEL